MKRGSGTVAALALFLPALALAQEPKPSPTPMRLSVTGGTIASLSAGASGVVPFSRVAVDAPLSTSAQGPRLRVVAELTGLPGESVVLEDPQSYRAIEFSVSAAQPLPSRLAFQLYAEGGFASRLPGDPLPRDKAPRWGALGLLMANDAGTARLALGLGGDQRLSGRYVLAATVTGHVKLREVRGVSAYLVGSAILSVGPAPAYGPAPRDSIRVGISLGV